MIRPIVHDPAALSVPADLATPADTQVLTDLLDTLAAHTDNCVGMAANMIGVNKQNYCRATRSLCNCNDQSEDH